MTVDRSVEIRALRRGDLVTIYRWQTHGVGMSGHRNETLAARARVDREAVVAAQLDRANCETAA